MSLYTLKNLSRIYHTGEIETKALDDISLELPHQGFVAILGPSGCGKTTLLNVLGGLDKPTSGSLMIDGKDTHAFKEKDWDSYRNHSVGFVFQSYHLIPHLNVYDNVGLAPTLAGTDKRSKDKAIKEALKKVDSLDKMKKKPGQLSGGQCQRVAIARAIVNNPEVILADEPTGALDQKNSTMVMDILKELAKDHLVVMVTHNRELANEYATRHIELLDGQIIKDTACEISDHEVKKEGSKKVHLNILTAFKLSFKNLQTKWLRSLLLVFAGTIGMIACGLVFCVSQGTEGYLADVQERSIGSYPITITSQAVETSTSGTTLKPYPTDNTVHIRYGETTYDNYNYIPEDYLDYIDNMDSSLYKAINYNRSISMKIITNIQDSTSYRQVSSFYELYDDEDFIGTQYDIVCGNYPQNKNEVLLIIDRYNAISASMLSAIGFTYDPESDHVWTLDDFIGKEYYYICNDHFYTKSDSTGLYYQRYSSAKYGNLVSEYESHTTESQGDQVLKIVGVIRPKKNATLTFYSSGLLYTHALTEYAYNNALASAMVTEQMSYGLSKSVFTGQEFTEQKDSYATYSAQYLYDSQLYSMGAIMKTTSIRIYTSSFDSRLSIEDYLDCYEENPDATSTVSYTDYYKDATVEFATLLKILTTVLTIFASISLVVACIMIAIVTYISVIERKQEIGILRAMGASSLGVGMIFNAETFIIGLSSGLLGILGCLIGVTPINNYVRSLISEYGYTFMADSTANLASFNILDAGIILAAALIVTGIAGVVPAIVASKKKPVDALRDE